MKPDEPLTPAELAFRELASRPAAYQRWAAEVRAAWERSRGVEWFHGMRRERGRLVEDWRPTRPRLDPDHAARFRVRPSGESIGDDPR